jgi:hypothetical protein
MYLSATAETFGEDVDYAMVVKEFRSCPPRQQCFRGSAL